MIEQAAFQAVRLEDAQLMEKAFIAERERLQASIVSLEKLLYRALHPADVYLEVGASPTGTSRFQTGMQDVDHGLRMGSEVAQQRLAFLDVVASHVMNFGAPNLWSDPKITDPEGWNWDVLTQRMDTYVRMGVTPALILYNWPVWARETVSDAGVPSAVNPATPFSTSGRPRLDMYGKMDIYNYEIAKRYLKAPYNVTLWLFGNELKGWWGRRDGKKGYAMEEYVALYDRFVAQVVRAAVELGINPGTLRFAAPYSPVRTEGTRNSDTVGTTHPLFGTPYGHFRFRPLDAIQYVLTHAKRVDVICFDAGLGNPEGGNLVDSFSASQKWIDLMEWIRSFSDKPVLIAEIYDQAADDGNANLQRTTAVKMVSTLTQIEAGYWMSWLWGAVGQGQPNIPIGGLLQDYGSSNPPLPWYEWYKMIGEHFAAGTNLYPVEVEGEGVFVKASETLLVMVNTTENEKRVVWGEKSYTLPPYGIQSVQRL